MENNRPEGDRYISLDRLPLGKRCRIYRVEGGVMSRRLQELGFVPGVVAEKLGSSPGGDPSAYLINGRALALRKKDSRTIIAVGCEEETWD